MKNRQFTLLHGMLRGAEIAINQALKLAPKSQIELDRLQQSILAIEITTFELTVFIEIDSESHVRLMTHFDQTPTIFVRGAIEDFSALVTSNDPASVLINSGIEVEGNSSTLIAFQKLISRVEIDWEAPLVAVLGDVIGHQFAQAFKEFFTWREITNSSIRRQVSEYLVEEGQLTPPKAELEHFFYSVQSLALKVDRLEARVLGLVRRAAQNRRET